MAGDLAVAVVGLRDALKTTGAVLLMVAVDDETGLPEPRASLGVTRHTTLSPFLWDEAERVLPVLDAVAPLMVHA